MKRVDCYVSTLFWQYLLFVLPFLASDELSMYKSDSNKFFSTIVVYYTPLIQTRDRQTQQNQRRDFEIFNISRFP